jgi:hypothetical protein
MLWYLSNGLQYLWREALFSTRNSYKCAIVCVKTSTKEVGGKSAKFNMWRKYTLLFMYRRPTLYTLQIAVDFLKSL